MLKEIHEQGSAVRETLAQWRATWSATHWVVSPRLAYAR